MREPTSPGELPHPWLLLRDEVEAADRMLSESIFELARLLFEQNYAADPASLISLTREYTSSEFLLVVDADGNPSPVTVTMLDIFHSVVERAPAFARWFEVGIIKGEDGAETKVMMAARWFCHLVGLRHGTVEIFIDPPEGYPGLTLVQVRGMQKHEAPGAFDIPCAGHINGVDSVEESLAKELREELNLGLEDLSGLRQLASGSGVSVSADGSVNCEYAVLYQARLKAESAPRIRFSDGEVAGLAVFTVTELRELIKHYPQRVASGLRGAIGYYTEQE